MSAAAFEFDISAPEAAGRWRDRVAHLMRTDPDGGFVAVEAGRVVGVAQAMLRETVWCLSLLTVDPAAQSRGIGRRLLEAALDYGRDGRAGSIIVASDDPRALTLYARAGFAVHPTLEAFGQTPPVAAAPGGVRGVGPDELASLAPISRAVRGAAHTPELEFALAWPGAEVLALEDRAFAVLMEGHGIWMLAARDETAARVVLRAGLARIRGSGGVARWITTGQHWAVQELIGHGLRLRTFGAVCVAGELGPLVPYLPSPTFA